MGSSPMTGPTGNTAVLQGGSSALVDETAHLKPDGTRRRSQRTQVGAPAATPFGVQHIPRPAHLQQQCFKLAFHVLNSCDLTEAERAVMLAIIGAGMTETAGEDHHRKPRVSNIRMPYRFLDQNVDTIGTRQEAWRIVQGLVEKDLLHISDRGLFADGEHRWRTCRVDLVMNSATARTAWKQWHIDNGSSAKDKARA
jgi:hypothetical protein